MDMDDVILWLVPHEQHMDSHTSELILEQNASRLAQAPPVVTTTTTQDDDSMSGTEDAFGGGDGCAILFSHGAKTSAGIIGGTAANADFVLPVGKGSSELHFAITFNKRYQPIVKDLGSVGGTKVTYARERGQRLSNFEWPLLGPSIAKGKTPVLHVSNSIAFRVILPERDYSSPQHIEMVEQFAKGTDHTKEVKDLLSTLATQSAEAPQVPTAQQTPAAARTAVRLYLERPLGAGAFGVVTFRFNFKTGRETAVKAPPKGSHFRLADWENEAKMLKRISHKHIVEFLEDRFPPKSHHPELEFEYAPGGSLGNYTDLSTLESTQVLHQLSSALGYLHNCDPPIGHRDIKPQNILVFHRGAPDGILVKFADFGLSKAGVDLKTCCGTPKWSAPELCAKFGNPGETSSDSYNVAVDIWSLGAVVGWTVVGEPEHLPDRDYVAVARNLQEFYMRKSLAAGSDLLCSDVLRIVCNMMLVVDPAGRSSAQQVEMDAYALLQRLRSDPSSHARIAALFDGDDDSSGWVTPPGQGTWDWDSQEQRVRWFANPEVEQATVREGGATAREGEAERE